MGGRDGAEGMSPEGDRGGASESRSDRLRDLPSVESVAAALDAPHPLAVAATRGALDAARAALLAGEAAEVDVVADARARLAEAERPSLRRVINASGVIVHTNLGRAPLPAAAREAAAAVAEGYSNLEYEVAEGRRGSRQAHVEELLRELTGAEAGMAVNNGAAAVLLAAAALAGPGREVVVSRGQLVEIGGSFRIPDVVAQSGAQLVEVGTTNRTRLTDYEGALSERTGAILRAHQSNFATIGFVEQVPIEDLIGLGPPVIDDVGSGRLDDGLPVLDDEPSVRRSGAGGAAITCFSGDKLLGGPQAGLMVGRGDAIALARAHPLARAMRIDKLSLAALAATLRLYRDPERARREVPVLAMLEADEPTLRARAQRLASALGGEVVEATAKVGGGALPLLELTGPVARLADPAPDRAAARLRAGDPPVIGRIAEGALLLDPRTMTDDDLELVCRR
jgi:L-seryl-tRNA(Ser) seleniumtransferase